MRKRVRILLVDDDRDLLQVLQLALEMDVYLKVVTSVDGREACLKYRNEEFDLIITDFKMPKMDGVDLINSLRDKKNKPILVISAAMDGFKFKLREQQTQDQSNIYLMPKPFHPDDLLKKIAEIIQLQDQKVKKATA